MVLRKQSWRQIPGKALSLSIGADGSVWHIGTGVAGDGLGIFQWTGSAWHQVEGAGVGVAVAPDGTPWHWNLFGHIFKREENNWRQMPGLARHIGIGPDGSVWLGGMGETDY